MPDFSAISASCSAMMALAGSSPSRPPSAEAGTRRLERWVPSSYSTSNSTKSPAVRVPGLRAMLLFLAAAPPARAQGLPEIRPEYNTGIGLRFIGLREAYGFALTPAPFVPAKAGTQHLAQSLGPRVRGGERSMTLGKIRISVAAHPTISDQHRLVAIEAAEHALEVLHLRRVVEHDVRVARMQ